MTTELDRSRATTSLLKRVDRRALRRLLVDSLRQDDNSPARLSAIMPKISERALLLLPTIASVQGISGQVEARLDAAHIVLPSAAVTDLREISRASTAFHLRVLRVLIDLTKAFRAAEVEWLVLKGPVLAGHIYQIAGPRNYSDLDVLVRPTHVDLAVEQLGLMGGVVHSPSRSSGGAGAAKEIQVLLPGGVAIDLHWHIIASPDVVRGLVLDDAAFFERSRCLDVGAAIGASIPVRTLDPTDQMIHLAVHSVRAGMGSLRLTLDIDQSWRNDPPSVAQLVARSNLMGAGAFVAVALQRAQRCLATPVAREVIEELAGQEASGWLRAMRVLDWLRPPESAHEKVTFGRVRATTRSTTRVSVRALLDLCRLELKDWLAGRCASTTHLFMMIGDK